MRWLLNLFFRHFFIISGFCNKTPESDQAESGGAEEIRHANSQIDIIAERSHETEAVSLSTTIGAAVGTLFVGVVAGLTVGIRYASPRKRTVHITKQMYIV